MGKINVYKASLNRIEECLLKYDKYYVAFSGGKDSGIMLNLVLQIAKKHNKKIAVLVVDTEAHYDYTYTYLENTINENLEYIELFWVALPLTLDNTLSCFANNWICWDENLKSNWIREKSKFAISDYNYFDFYKYGMTFYDFISKFAEWYADKKRLCCFVGLRAKESDKRMKMFLNSNFYIFKNTKHSVNSYPIFDWEISDIWKYYYQEKKEYNKIYDLMQMAGLPFKEQRVGQLFGNEQKRFLSITRVIDHKVWVKMLYRVNGVDFTSRITDSGTLRNISKPKNKTWEEFALFICNTMPQKQKYLIKNRIQIIINSWKKRDYICIPDEAPKELEKEIKAISWRLICKSLLKNDFNFNGYKVVFRKNTTQDKIRAFRSINNQENLFSIN